MSHKCAFPGCRFHLPDAYLVPLCPWHAAPGKGIKKMIFAAGMLAVGVGGSYAVGKARQILKRHKTEAEQDQWRMRGEAVRRHGEIRPDEAVDELPRTG